MKSTGEVMGLDTSFDDRLRQEPARRRHARAAQGHRVRVGARRATRCAFSTPSRLLASHGFKIVATSGTQRFLVDNGVPAEKINKVLEGRPHIVDAITNGEIQLVFNTTDGPQALADSRSLRRAALLHKVPYYTTLSGAVAAAQGSRPIWAGDLEVRTLQSYFSQPDIRAEQVRRIGQATGALRLFCSGTR